MLRAGGYFPWAAQPVYKHEAVLEEQWEEMVNLTTRLCLTLVKKEGYIAIWQKPLYTSCYLSREEGTHPPLCEPDDSPDNVWCNISTSMLEMDRMLRPGGKVYIMDELQEIGTAIGWHVTVSYTSEGPHASYMIGPTCQLYDLDVR